MNNTAVIPRTFIWRRLHSLMGLWLVLFLIEHLLVNSQAALWVGDNGRGFLHLVEGIHNLPYRQAVEIFLLGVPILFHGVLGIQYLWTGKFNSFRTDGSAPSLPEYSRNRAYTWQRITSWIVLFLLLFHVIKFRFIEYPLSATVAGKTSYFVNVHMDDGLYTVAKKLNVQLYDTSRIDQEKASFEANSNPNLSKEAHQVWQADTQHYLQYNPQTGAILIDAQFQKEKQEWFKTLATKKIEGNRVVAVSEDFGSATLLTIRDAFKYPVYVIVYTIFVLATCFHAFNGFWTFLITWGVVLKAVAQRRMTKVAWGLMALVAFWGLATVWGTYWINLRT